MGRGSDALHGQASAVVLASPNGRHAGLVDRHFLGGKYSLASCLLFASLAFVAAAPPGERKSVADREFPWLRADAANIDSIEDYCRASY